MSDDADDPKTAWPKRREHRVASVSAPYGPLSLIGTLCQAPSGGTPTLSDYPEGRIPALPGRRRATEGGVAPTASAEDDGSLGAVGDAGGGNSGYPFRFPRPGTADPADGSITVDFRRTVLPPWAFADHFICPFPPPGNTLPFEVAAGERRLKDALAA